MLKCIHLLISIVFTFQMCACEGVEMEGKYDNISVNGSQYTQDDFIGLQSNSTYEEVTRQFGEGTDVMGGLCYHLNNGEDILLTFSFNKKLKFITMKTQEGEFYRFHGWEEREKRDHGGRANSNFTQSDFSSLKVGTSFDEIVGKFGDDYIIRGSGLIIISYLLQDFNMVLIHFDSSNRLSKIQLLSLEGQISEFKEWEDNNFSSTNN